MMHVKTLFVVVIVAILFPILLLAQAQDWGKITEEELIMEGIPEDPEADAVILFNTSRLQITPDFDLEVFYHKRIKILTEAGKEYANVEIRFWHEDKIYDLEATCYTTDGKKHKLDDDNVFEERNKKWKKKKFAIPGAEIGSVIEFKYQLFSKYIGGLEPWAFQEQDFTRYSEITVFLPAGFTYSALPINILEQDIERTEKNVRNPYDFNKRCSKFTWIVRNKSGIKREPYMKAFQDYYAQVLFQLVAFKNQYFHQSFAKTWDEIAKSRWDFFKGRIKQNSGIKDFTKNLVEGITDPQDKVEKIYDYVRKEIRTTGTNSLSDSKFKKPKEVFKSKEGSTNEKNILLINMLKHAGINANMLLISTRNNGVVFEGWVALQQFNRVISYVKVGKKIFYLNSGHKYCPMGYLTPEYDVDVGLLIDEEKGQIIDLKSRKPKNRLEIDTKASLTENGQITAHTKIEYIGMNGITERDRIEEKDLDDFLPEVLEDIHTEAVLDSFNYSNVDSSKKPLVLDIYYHIPSFIEDAGSLIFFNIPLFTGLSKNVFVRETRNFPVDFEFEQTRSEKIKIQLADCYQINEIPKKTKTRMRSLAFNKFYFSKEKSLECNRTYKLSTKRFSEFDYPKLRQIYEKIVNSDQDQVVLTRQ